MVVITNTDEATLRGLLAITLSTQSRIESLVRDTAVFEIAAHFAKDGFDNERARAEIDALWADEPECKSEENLLDHTVAKVIERVEANRPRLSRGAESAAYLLWLGLLTLGVFVFWTMITASGTLTTRLLLSLSLLPVAALWGWVRERNDRAVRIP